MSAPCVEISCTGCGQRAEVTAYQATVKKHLRCRACVAEAARLRRAERKAAGTSYRRDPAKAAKYEQARSAIPAVRARRAADMRRYTSDPALRYRHEARWQVRRAIAAGRLVRQPCEVCGAEKTHGHHDDYSKPLDVRWLCQVHHREYHARIGGAS